MDESESLSHSRWECKYHVVFIPKCRRKTLYEQLRRHLGEVFHKVAEQKESRILEGHLMPDHGAHADCGSLRSMRCRRWSGSSKGRVPSILLGYMASAGATSLGRASGLGAILSRPSAGTRRRSANIRNQEQEDQRLDQLSLWG